LHLLSFVLDDSKTAGYVLAMDEKPKRPRGFAAMSPEKRKAIASRGGTSVPKEKRSFSQSRDLAARAGRDGGLNVDPGKRAFRKDPALAAAAGRKGGLASRRTAAPADKPDSTE
jgi:general stress protein YciG